MSWNRQLVPQHATVCRNANLGLAMFWWNFSFTPGRIENLVVQRKLESYCMFCFTLLLEELKIMHFSCF